MAFTVEPRAWKGWRPVLTGVQPATEKDLAVLETRARLPLAMEYTATALGAFGELELAQDGPHVRVSFGAGDNAIVEVHASRGRPPRTDLEAVLGGPMTVCLHQERECVALTGDEEPGDKPHLFDTIIDGLLAQASMMTAVREYAPAALLAARREGAVAGVATVDSPVGQLDCALLVEAADTLNGLEGAPLDLESAERTYAALCIDARGLVVVSPHSSFMPLTAYTSLRPTVDGGVDRLPYPAHAYQP